jgi:ketosteroid isomerase-like protein
MGSGDAKGAFALLAPDVRYRVMGTTPISGEAVGMGEFVAKTLRPFVSRLQDGKIEVVPDEFVASGDRVVVLAHSIATAVTGAAYNNEYAMVFGVRDGLIATVREYLDTALVETAVFGNEIKPA